MHTLWRDARHAMRLMLRNPGFTGLAVMVLALGIGANTGIFTVVNTLLFRPSSFEKPDELVGCFSKNVKRPNSYRAFSYPNYLDLREKNNVFADLMAHSLAMVGVREGDTTRRVMAEIVSAYYFRTLGVSLWKGRVFDSTEEKPGSAPVVIVSYEYWRRAGQDPDFVGKSLWINGRACTVIGVAREGFTGRTMVATSGIWLPLGMYEATINDFMGVKRPLADRDNHCLFLVGRLSPGVSPSAADSRLAILSAQLENAYPKENADQTVITHRLSRFTLSTAPRDEPELSTVSILLSGMAGLVLLISCFNLANMMLARGTARRKEFAIRQALGCGRGRVIAQLLTEGFLLSLLGAAVGLLFAVWGTRLLVHSINSVSPVPILLPMDLDIRVFAAMLGFCLFSTLIFGLGPAWKAVKPDVVTEIKECIAGDGGRRRRLFASRNLLVVGQLALSLTLLAAAGLFVRGAVKAADPNPGYSLDNALLVELDAGLVGYDEARGRAAYRRVWESLSALPGVEAAAEAATVPFGMTNLGRSVLKAEDAAIDAGTDSRQPKAIEARFNVIGADYFRVLGVRLLRGRAFDRSETDSAAKVKVAIIDEALARQLWPEGDALGMRISFRDDRVPEGSMEVIGVVPTLRDSLLEPRSQPHIYVPFGQSYQSNLHFHLRLRSAGPAAAPALMRDVRQAIRSADENIPVLNLKTMREQLATSIDLWLFGTGARMLSLLGGLALMLAVVGMYGLRAYTVVRRTREIGIRMALGATVRGTLWMTLREGALLTLFGTVVGLALAVLTGRLLSNLLYEVSPMDPVVFVAVPLLMNAVALLASYFPARRAARVDPMSALRYE